MSNLILVLGESGNGKSTSIKGLNPNETIICNVLGKRLPFKGSKSQYNEEKKNLFKISNWENIIKLLNMVDKSKPDIKNIVIDDATYIMRNEFFDRSKERGFDKYNELADHYRRIIASCNSLRDDLNIFMFMHAEPIEADGSVIGYKSSSVGKLLDKMYRPEENVTMTLFAQPKFDDKGNAQFGFWTHKSIVNGVELPAKTPDGMFEEDFIANDLGVVLKTMDEFYN